MFGSRGGYRRGLSATVVGNSGRDGGRDGNSREVFVLDDFLAKEETPGENQTFGPDDAEASGEVEDSILDIFEAEESEDEALKELARGLENIDIIELMEHCSTVLEQFEVRC